MTPFFHTFIFQLFTEDLLYSGHDTKYWVSKMNKREAQPSWAYTLMGVKRYKNNCFMCDKKYGADALGSH